MATVVLQQTKPTSETLSSSAHQVGGPKRIWITRSRSPQHVKNCGLLTGGVAPNYRSDISCAAGVTVELRNGKELIGRTVTGDSCEYSFSSLAQGIYELGISLVNFAPIDRGVSVTEMTLG